MFPIRKHNVPNGRKITYANFICNIHLQNKETQRAHLTTRGDHIDYPGNTRFPTESILDPKMNINSNISDAKHRACYLRLNTKNFYLSIPISYYQYIHMHHTIIPQEVKEKYNLHVEPDGNAYFNVHCRMYGLKESGIIAFLQLVKKLASSRYEPMQYTLGLWQHKTRKTTFPSM